MILGIKNKRQEQGFTLVEVLASLVIFSFAILGLTTAGSQTVSTLNMIEQRTYASIVADNQLALARLQTNAQLSRTQTGEVEAGGREYAYRVTRIDTPVPGFFELLIQVSKIGSEQILIERRAFITGDVS